MIDVDSDLLYFGCWRARGHYLWTRHGQMSARRDLERIGPRNIDGDFAPHPTPHRNGYCDCPQVEGTAALHHVEGWTILAFWDRSVDGRRGSNSAFLVYGEHSFDDMLALSRGHFGEVWQRWSFRLELYSPAVRTPSEIRIEQLEARVRELEARVRELEAVR